MPSIALDSGPAYALFARRDKHHRRAVDFLQGATPGSLVTPVPVVVEVALMLHPNAERFLAWVSEAVTVDEALVADLPRICEFMAKYRDIGPDLADASLIALCERRAITRVATIDSDFQHYRTKDGSALQIAF